MRAHISFTFLALLLYGCTPNISLETTEPVAPVEPVHNQEKPIEASSVLDPRGSVLIGNNDAKHTLIVFTEYHCTYCMEFQRNYISAVSEEFIKPGTIRIQFVPFQLAKYPLSANINKGLVCAKHLGKGLEMHTALTKYQADRRIAAEEYAPELELDAESFTRCIESEETNALLSKQQDTIDQLGIERVPTFLLNGKKKVGLPNKADLLGWIRESINN